MKKEITWRLIALAAPLLTHEAFAQTSAVTGQNIKSVFSGLCLKAANGQVSQAACDTSALKLTEEKQSDGFYRLIVSGSGVATDKKYVIEMPRSGGTKDNFKFTIWESWLGAGSEGQQFSITFNSDGSRVYKNRASGKCAGIASDSKTAGAFLVQIGCGVTQSQKFISTSYVAPAPTPAPVTGSPISNSNLKLAASNLCLKANSGTMIQATCDSSSLKITEEKQSDGYYRLVASGTGVATDKKYVIEQPGNASGLPDNATFKIWESWTGAGSEGQQFSITFNSDGSRIYKNRYSGKCLRAENASTASGANIVQFTCQSASAEKLIPTTAVVSPTPTPAPAPAPAPAPTPTPSPTPSPALAPFVGVPPYYVKVGTQTQEVDLGGIKRIFSFGGDNGSTNLSNPNTGVGDWATINLYNPATGTGMVARSWESELAPVKERAFKTNGYTALGVLAGDGVSEAKLRTQMNSFGISAHKKMQWDLIFKFGSRDVNGTWVSRPAGESPSTFWQIKTYGWVPPLSMVMDNDNNNPGKIFITVNVKPDPNAITQDVATVRNLDPNQDIQVKIETQLDDGTYGNGYIKIYLNGNLIVNRTGPVLQPGATYPYNWSMGMYLIANSSPLSYDRFIFIKRAVMSELP